jgi:Cu/Ag efflux protein CusF
MRRMAAATAVLVLQVASPRAEAAAESADKGSAYRENGALREVRGRVSGIDKDHNQLTLESAPSRALTLQLDRTTTVFLDGHTSSLDEVREGAEVRASYEVKRGSNRAQWIEISKKRQGTRDAPEPPAADPAGATPAGATPAGTAPSR